jgi:phytoene desaturase
MSLFLLYFGLKKQYHHKLAHHTLFLGTEYKKLLDEIFEKHALPSTLSLYLHIPTITDPSMAPDGCESMYILVPMPNFSQKQYWKNEIEQRIRDWIVDYLEHYVGLENFTSSIEVEHRFTPTDFLTVLQSFAGAAFATELSLFQSVYFRQHNKADELENLYFVGAGTHPGPGVPGVLKSAECTASLILH